MSTDPTQLFQDLTYGLMRQSENISIAMQGSPCEQRKWMFPEGEWSPLQPDSLNSVLDRNDMNQRYQDALHQEGTMGEAGAAKVQLDYAAAYERALRARHLTLARGSMHAAARRKGHGHPNGTHAMALVYAQNLIKSGQEAEG